MNTCDSKARAPGAVVIGLDSMQGIQTARTLSRHGIPVIAIASDPEHHCCRTNFCNEILYANTQTEEFLQTLSDIAARGYEKPVLYACHDETVRIVSRNRSSLEKHFRLYSCNCCLLLARRENIASRVVSVMARSDSTYLFLMNRSRSVSARSVNDSLPCHVAHGATQTRVSPHWREFATATVNIWQC